jgi:hypothetical protein
MIAVSARWVQPDIRKSPLVPYKKTGEEKALTILDHALSNPSTKVSAQVKAQLEKSIPQDIEELLPYLETRGEEIHFEASSQLSERGRIESEEMVRVLTDQRERVLKQLKDPRGLQLEFELDDEHEKKQYAANRKYWEKWLLNVDGDLQREPQRVRDFYAVKSARIEPVGLVYLWPITG